MPEKDANGDFGTRKMGPRVEPAINPALRTQDTISPEQKARVTRANVKKQANIVPEAPQDAVTTEDEYAYDPTEVVAVEEVFEYQPSDRIPAGEIIYVRNNTRGIVRWTDGYKSDGTFNLKLDPAGDPGSIASIETFGILRNPGFQRWWKQGKVTVSNDPRLQPKPMDWDQIEIERHQQFALEGTLERTARGSLPIPKELDMSFLDETNPNSPKYKYSATG